MVKEVIRKVIKQMNKYDIISFHLKGMSIREISRLLGISRNTVTKYIEKYEHDTSSLMDESQTINQRAIIESIVEEPKYDTRNRKAFKYNEEIDALLDRILADEEKKSERLGSHHKQKLSMSQIHQLIVEEGYVG